MIDELTFDEEISGRDNEIDMGLFSTNSIILAAVAAATALIAGIVVIKHHNEAIQP